MASGALDPIVHPQAWDVLVVAGVKSPGRCEVSEFKRKHEFDIKKAKGMYGAAITFVGRPPCTGSVKFYLWTSQHFLDWESFRTLLKYDPTKSAVEAVEIFHPSLADLQLNAVVTESIGNIVHEGKQLYSCTVDFLEYFPPPKTSAVSTPTSAKTDEDGAEPPDPIGDAQQAVIRQQNLAAALP